MKRGRGKIKARKGTQATQGTFWWIEVPAAETHLQTSTPFKTKNVHFLQPCLTKENLFYDPNSLFFFCTQNRNIFQKDIMELGCLQGNHFSYITAINVGTPWNNKFTSKKKT